MLSTIHFSKDAYTKGTKKQKMNISESIVDAIYSMEPPGRFLKKCTETGRWTEIPKKEAADKAAQAMAYVIRAGVATAKKKPPQPRSRSSQRGAVTISSQRPRRSRPGLDAKTVGIASSSVTAQGSGRRIDRGGDVGRNLNPNNDADDDDDDGPGGESNIELSPGNSILQQRIQSLQQSSNTDLPSTSAAPPPNDLSRLDDMTRLIFEAQVLARVQQQHQLQQQQQQQQQLLLRYLIDQQHSFGLPPALPLPLSFSEQASSAQAALQLNDILRQAPTSLGQNQANFPITLPLANPNVGLHNSLMGNYFLRNQPILRTATAPQASQQLDQVAARLMLAVQQLDSLLIPALNHLSLQQQSQLLDLLQQMIDLLQQNSPSAPPNNYPRQQRGGES